MSILLVASLTLLPPLNESHVETVQALVIRLAPEVGKPVEVDRTLAGLPIYVDRRSMTAAETLDSVAFGLRASLVKSEKGWRITRTDQDKEDRLRATRAAWRELTTKWIARAEQNARQATGLGDRRARIDYHRRLLSEQLAQLQKGTLSAPTLTADPEEFTPIGELYRNLIKGMGAEKLAETRPEARRTWSNRPTSGQLAYPGGDALLQAYDQQQQLFLTEAGGSANSSPMRFTFQQSDGIQFRLVIYDEAGKVIGTYGGAMVTENMAGPVAISYRQMAKPFAEKTNALHALDDSAIGYFRFLHSPGGPPVPKENVPAPIQNPDQTDPLDPFVRPAFADVARTTDGKGLVIVPTDQLLRVAEECVVENKMNVAGFRHIFEEKMGFEKVGRLGVTVMRARDPFRAEAFTADRQILANQTRFLLKRPSIGMTDIAVSFYRVFPAEQSPAAEQLFRSIVISQPRFRSTVLNNQGTVLALFGAAFEASGNRSGVTMNSKVGPFRRLINRCVNYHWLRFESAQSVPAAALDAATLVDALDYEGRLVLETSVVPAMALLGVKPAANATPDRVTFVDPLKIGAMLGSSASQMAQILYPGQKDKLPKQDEVLKAIQESGSYHVGFRDEIYLDLYAKTGIRASLSLQQTRPEKTFVKYENLSPNYQKALLEGAMKAVEDIGKGPTISGTFQTTRKKADDPPRR